MTYTTKINPTKVGGFYLNSNLKDSENAKEETLALVKNSLSVVKRLDSLRGASTQDFHETIKRVQTIQTQEDYLM